jgi:outer membrane lipoprotein-sorting protein
MYLVACLLAVASAAAGAAETESESGDAWTLKSALKQIDKATKKLGGVKAEVRYAEVFRGRPIEGSGTIYVSPDGRVRADLGGSNQRTFLSVPPYLYLYRPVENLVEIYEMASHPDLLVQYALLGFVPAGSGLKKQYDLILVEQGVLDDNDVLLIELTPKSDEIGRAISSIRLWIDPSTWLPAQQMIFHKTSGIQLTIRYLDLSYDDELPGELFRPAWPDGTKSVRM